MNSIRKRYDRIFRSLGRAQLQHQQEPEHSENSEHSETTETLSFEDLLENKDKKWLGFYSKEGMEYALEQYGFFEDLRTLGYEELEVCLRLDDPQEHMVRILSNLPALKEPLLELVARRTQLLMRDEARAHIHSEQLPVLSLEWLMLQNPMGSFANERTLLPGQQLPGLGLGGKTFELLRNVCRRLNLITLVNTPSYFHNAMLYSAEFSFLDPLYQGRFKALVRDLLMHKKLMNAVGMDAVLSAASWAIFWELVYDQNDPQKPCLWFHEPMVSHDAEHFADYFLSDWYVQEVTTEFERTRYTTSTDVLVQALEDKGIIPLHEERLKTFLMQIK